MDLEKSLGDLPSTEQESFRQRLVDCLYSRFWCKRHDIDYTNPDVSQAKFFLYSQLYRGK